MARRAYEYKYYVGQKVTRSRLGPAIKILTLYSDNPDRAVQISICKYSTNFGIFKLWQDYFLQGVLCRQYTESHTYGEQIYPE